MKRSKQKENLPKGWILTSIGEIGIVSSGGTPSRSNPGYFTGNIPWVKSGELNNKIITATEEKITLEALESSNAKILPKGTLMVALYGATVGKLGVLGIEACTNQAVCSIITTKSTNTLFLFYFLMYNRDNLLQKRVGGAQPNINQKIIINFPLPLPSTSVQDSIVKRIEEIFSEIDDSIERLKDIELKLTLYQQALIDDQYKKIDAQKFLPLSEICTISGGVTKGRNLAGRETVQLPYLRVANVQDGYLDLHEVKSIAILKKEREKYLLATGDILYTEGGDRDKLGRGTVWRGEIKECVHQNHVFRARSISDQFNPDYISYFSKTRVARDYFYQNGKQTTNLASINISILSGLLIPIASIEEQLRIVQEIDSKLSIYKNSISIVKQTLSQIQNFKNTVLKKAFEGRLNHEGDSKFEIVDNLLTQIKFEKEAFLSTQKSITKTFPKNRTKMSVHEIIEILQTAKKPITAKEVWDRSKYRGEIEKFYASLKKISYLIIEKPKGVLSLKNK